MKTITATVYDHEEWEIADRDLNDMLSEAAGFSELEDRTREGLWSLLGSVYELAPAIEGVPARKERLIGRVSLHADVADNNQWQPGKKKVDDLLLVLLFGLERRQTKSQWLSALRIAADQGIPPTRAAFIEWMQQVGGVDGARKLAKCPASNGYDLSSYAEQLKSFGLDYQGIVAPGPLTDTNFPSGLGVVLVRRNADGALLPMGTLTNEKLVASAARQLLRERGQQKREDRSGIEADINESEQTDQETPNRFIGREIIAGEYPEYLV